MGLFKPTFYGKSDMVKSEALIDTKKINEKLGGLGKLRPRKEPREERKTRKPRPRKKVKRSFSTKAFTGSTFRKAW